MMTGPHRARPRYSSDYQLLEAGTVLAYLSELGIVNTKLGGLPTQWRAHEFGDGNLNLIFVVEGSAGAVIVKQALPYVRMVGESWPLSVRRNYFEHAALQEQARWAPEFVPAVYHADENMALIAMEFLTPHAVLRSELITAHEYPRVGTHLGQFLAQTLFNTSALRLSGHAKKARREVFLSNTAMCEISENLIFDEPYFAAPLNRHTSPQLDLLASELQRDTDLKVAVQEMKWRFTNHAECLIHGDLHTGSVMVTKDDTRVIDPEFAFYGPMGFDIGVLLANFLLAYFSQAGHAASAGDRDPFERYLLQQLTAIWTSFVLEFSALWNQRGTFADANLCNSRLDLASPAFSDRALASRLQQIWQDTLGFAGCEIIRRIVGLAHVADFETIGDANRRSQCERRAVDLARDILVKRSRYPGIVDLITLARAGE